MATVVDTLRELHRLRKLIRDLEGELVEGPQMLASQQAKLARAEHALKDAQDGLKHAKVNASDKEKTLKSTLQQMAKYEKQRETAASKKELDAFDAEIRHAKEKCSQLEDEILAGLTDIDERTAKLPEIERELAQVKAESASFQQDAQERHGRLTRELERAQAELIEQEKNVPHDVLVSYKRLVASYGADALAQVENRTCTSCNASITLVLQREVEAGKFATCKSCGRGLYV